ncbi:unnamed protein product [Cunninghamella blakesleeana]
MTTAVTPNETTTTLKVVELTQSIDNTCSDSSDSETIGSDEDCSACCASCCAASIENNRERIGNYTIDKKLYSSEYGKIKLGSHTDSEQKFIIEVIKKRDNTQSSEVNQLIEIHKTLKHPNIIKLIDVVETPRRTGIVLEYPLGGDLFDYILEKATLNEEEAAKLFAQLVGTVKYMHSKGVVHRDLKLENIFFSDEERTNLLVANFNFANNANKDLLTTNCGSPIYAAPEIIFHEPNGYHGPTADIWSLGVVLFCILCGYLPFDDDEENPSSENTSLLYRYIRTSSLSVPPHVSDEAKDLISSMLQSDASLRCNMDFITHHPWLHLYHDQLNNVDYSALERQATIVIETLRPEDNHHHRHDHHINDQQQEQGQENQQNDTHSKPILPEGSTESENHTEIKPNEEESKQDEEIKVETDIEKSKGKEKAKDIVVTVDVDEKSKEDDHEKLPSLQTSTTTSSSASTSNTPISPSTTNNNIATELNNNFDIVEDEKINLTSSDEQKNLDDKYNSTQLNTSIYNATFLKDIPVPPIPNENDPILNDSNITTGRQPSIRRLPSIKPSRKDSISNTHNNNNNDDNNNNTNNNNNNNNNVDGGNDDDDHHSVAHIDQENNNVFSPNLLSKNENKTNTVDRDATNDKNGTQNINNSKSASTPQLNNIQNTITDTAQPKNKNNENINNDNKKNVKRRDKRDSALSGFFNRQRSHSTHLLSSPFSPSPKTPKDQAPLQRNASTSRTMDHSKVTRNQTIKNSIRSIFGKRKSTSGKSPTSQSSTSSSSVSTTFDIAPKQQQQQRQEEESSEVISSSPTTPLEVPLRLLTTSSTRECLTKVSPDSLILSLMRILSALGIKNQLKSTYKIVCLRPSDHHNQDITKRTDPSLYKVAPIYGPDSIDKGHHIDFTIEICKSPIQGVYALDFHKSKGDTSAFQFVKAKILALIDS